MFSLSVQFIMCDVMSERLTKKIAQFSNVFTPDIGLCKSFHFSPINCTISSVNRSVMLVPIYCRVQSYVTRPVLCQNEPRKKMPYCPSLRVIKICRFCGTNNVPPSVQITVLFFTQFYAQATCTV